MELYKLALKQGINFAPGPIFSPSGNYQHCIRLNYGISVERFIPALETLGQLANALSK